MIQILTAGAFLLAWFVFRYDRHGRRRDALEAAEGTLQAVHYGMVQGLTQAQAVGWGQLYFYNEYDQLGAQARAQQTYDTVMNGAFDQIFVVPIEPLARLATSPPQEGLIEAKTVATANFALWRIHVFNQLVNQLTEFYSTHGDEIGSEATGQARREELAAAARQLSYVIHHYAIGWSWSAREGQGEGWYGVFVRALGANMRDLYFARREHRWQWLRLREWPYSGIDLLVIGSFVAVVVLVLR